MGETDVKNAKITSTMIGFEDHGCLTYMINLDYGGVSQGAGMGMFGNKKKQNGALFTEHIVGVLVVVGVSTWEELVGKSVRVVSDHCQVYKIGHYLEDKWFTLHERPEEKDTK